MISPYKDNINKHCPKYEGDKVYSFPIVDQTMVPVMRTWSYVYPPFKSLTAS
jgi:hypothetical protein